MLHNQGLTVDGGIWWDLVYEIALALQMAIHLQLCNLFSSPL